MEENPIKSALLHEYFPVTMRVSASILEMQLTILLGLKPLALQARNGRKPAC